jgi:hypothetical protein
MSAGPFIISKYAASYGGGVNTHPIRVQPETTTATHTGTTNAAPTGAITSPISARSSTGRRALGLLPRSVTLKAPATGQPAGYKPEGITRIPCLQEAFYNKCLKGTIVSYLGVNWIVVGVSSERVS